MMTLDDLSERFDGLGVWKASGQRAPHKPLLVLWAIGRCLRGEDRMVSYREAAPALKMLLTRFGLPRKTVHPEQPFWRLRKDGVWEVPGSERITKTSSGDALVSSLRQENAHGGFPKEIYEVFQTDKRLAVRIAYSLLDAHFPTTLHEAVLQAVEIDPGFGYVRHRPRNRQFSDTVLAAYGHRCAVCDFSIRMEKGPIGLEAAHIKWHCAQGPDLVQNALSLCALHHRLFDAGAFTLSPEYRVLVSGQVTGSGFDEVLGRFESREILLTEDNGDVPGPDFLKWHYENVFQGEFQ